MLLGESLESILITHSRRQRASAGDACRYPPNLPLRSPPRATLKPPGESS